jgi:outer membrane lipoprotein-sorting protein
MLPRFSIVLVVLLLALVGCRTTSTLDIGSRSITSTEVQETVRTHHAYVQSIKGEGRISVESPGMAQSGSFVLTLRKPDSVLINLQGPFGIKVGLVLITRNEFFFYNSLQNKLITGSSNMENLNRILHVQLSFDDLLNLFAGGTFLKDDLRSPDETHVEDNQLVFIYASHNSSRRYWIDPVSLLIQKIQFLDTSGKLTLEETFSNFEDVNGVAMPYSVRIIQPSTRRMLVLSYSDIAVNAKALQFTFSIPHNAERIHW